ncbi:hypothetical protein IEQ34_016623 [Dendrobium chrysotoxum]|uniref:Uncharacterized protein n=1 Tax=Dendrobium chrysotoxum TaxID=161865 RepID=A0AAV7GG92_DENCH|nr:hypothetical protein IEQ34_016623 [Dendrobium chrysotoxum]
MQYEDKFTALARYVPQLISIAEEKCYRFLRGLRDELRHPLLPLRIQEFLELVERTRLVENDLTIPQFIWDMNMKRSGDDMTKRESCEKMSRFLNSLRGTESSVGTKCRRRHFYKLQYSSAIPLSFKTLGSGAKWCHKFPLQHQSLYSTGVTYFEIFMDNHDMIRYGRGCPLLLKNPFAYVLRVLRAPPDQPKVVKRSCFTAFGMKKICLNI